MPTCSVPSCTNPANSRGYCMTHYIRWRKYGDVLADVPIERKGLPKPPCTVEGCTHTAKMHGYCAGHAKRLKMHGDVQADVPLKNSMPKGSSIDERLWQYIDKSGGPDACWPWAGYLNHNGYGRMHIVDENGKGTTIAVHRRAYESVHGPLPDDVVLDHLCHTTACTLGSTCPHRRCCNPSHLQPSTHVDNVRRGNSGMHKRAQTQCKNGHLFDEANTYIRADGTRMCRACRRLSNKRGVPSQEPEALE